MVGPVFVSPCTTSHDSSLFVPVSLVFHSRCSHIAVAQLAPERLGHQIVLLQVMSGALVECAPCWRNSKHPPCVGHELHSHPYKILETHLSHLRLSVSRAHWHNDFVRMKSHGRIIAPHAFGEDWSYGLGFFQKWEETCFGLGVMFCRCVNQ